MTPFDTMVIGSSPLLLIEALYLEREGHRVAVVEKRDRLGGAWYAIPLWEFDSVQPACHYIERGRRGYAFLQEYLGITLEPQSVKAAWFHLDDTTPGFLKATLSGRFLSDDVWGVIKSINRKDPGKFGRAIRRMILSPPYRYPAGGAHRVVDALARKVEASTIELLKSATVERVALGGDGRPNECHIDGRTHAAQRLIVGRHVYPRLNLTGRVSAEADDKYEITLVLRIAGEKHPSLDYLEIHRNDLVNRVQDVTAFTEPRSSDLVLCCNLTNTSTKDAPVDCEAVFAQLIDMGLLKNDARLLNSHIERYPTPLTSEADSTDAVTIFNTYDLGVGLQRNAKRWKSLLQR